VGGCEQKAAPTPAASASSAAALQDFTKMDAKQRLAVAAQPCYTDETCPPERTKALLAAEDGRARADLESAVQQALAAQVQTRLAKKHSTVVRVSTNAGVVTIAGVCDKFVLENFLATPGKHARFAGLRSVRCESKALQAEALIP
jgi:hypothetical protein